MGRRIIITEEERRYILEKYDRDSPTFVSSNEFKIKEFQKHLPNVNIEKGEDLDEVMGNKDEVIIYKSIDAGPGKVVEDTILVINGEEIVDIRWKADELQEGDDAIWVVSLGYNDGETITVYRGMVKGKIKGLKGGYGFGSNLYVQDYDKPIDAIENDMHYYSARRIALNNFKNNRPLYTVQIDRMPSWDGEYQH